MTRRQDLLEAQASIRRRMLALLIGGTPDGEEPEPPRSGRPLLGGLALAVLVALATAALEVVR